MITGNFIVEFFAVLFSGFASTSITAGAAFLSALAVAGVSILIDMLTPKPPEQKTDPQIESFISNQTANTTKAGCAAPLVFGEALVGSVVISAGADTVQVADNSP